MTAFAPTAKAMTPNQSTTNTASCSARAAAKSSSVLRPVNQPLYWVGPDRVLLDDISRFGLRRWVIAHKEDCPDMVSLLQQAFKRAGDAEVHYWMVWKDDGYCYLWIVWKEGAL